MEFDEKENAERIQKLNDGLAKSDLPYHTAETEKIQADRAEEQPEE